MQCESRPMRVGVRWEVVYPWDRPYPHSSTFGGVLQLGPTGHRRQLDLRRSSARWDMVQCESKPMPDWLRWEVVLQVNIIIMNRFPFYQLVREPFMVCHRNLAKVECFNYSQ